MKEFKNYFLIAGIRVYYGFTILPKGTGAVMLFGYIFNKMNKDELRFFLQIYYGKIMVNHERIHII